MKTLLKLSAGIMGVLFASWLAFVVTYHCYKPFRWAVKDLVTEQENQKQIDKYLESGIDPKTVKSLIAGRSFIQYEFNKVIRANEPEFIPFQLPR